MNEDQYTSSDSGHSVTSSDDEEEKWYEMDRFIYHKHEDAALNGYLDQLIHLHKKTGIVGDEYVCFAAASKGHLHVVKYMHSQGIPLTKYISYNACISGNIQLLQYLNENKCPWDERCLNVIIENNHIEALKYLLDTHVMPENRKALNDAISYGNLEMVKLLHLHGYEITKDNIITAINGCEDDSIHSEEDYLEIVKCLLTYCDTKYNEYFRAAIVSGKLKIAKWLYKNGYPIGYDYTNVMSCRYLQHKLGLVSCLSKCMYCDARRIKKCRVALYDESGYGAWLSSESIETLIRELY